MTDSRNREKEDANKRKKLKGFPNHDLGIENERVLQGLINLDSASRGQLKHLE